MFILEMMTSFRAERSMMGQDWEIFDSLIACESAASLRRSAFIICLLSWVSELLVLFFTSPPTLSNLILSSSLRPNHILGQPFVSQSEEQWALNLTARLTFRLSFVRLTSSPSAPPTSQPQVLVPVCPVLLLIIVGADVRLNCRIAI